MRRRATVTAVVLGATLAIGTATLASAATPLSAYTGVTPCSGHTIAFKPTSVPIVCRTHSATMTATRWKTWTRGKAVGTGKYVTGGHVYLASLTLDHATRVTGTVSRFASGHVKFASKVPPKTARTLNISGLPKNQQPAQTGPDSPNCLDAGDGLGDIADFQVESVRRQLPTTDEDQPLSGFFTAVELEVFGESGSYSYYPFNIELVTSKGFVNHNAPTGVGQIFTPPQLLTMSVAPTQVVDGTEPFDVRLTSGEPFEIAVLDFDSNVQCTFHLTEP